MDVVKQAILKLKGSCEISSVLGKGSRFLIRLPLTLAVFNGMIIKVGNGKYVVPNSDVEEIIRLNEEKVRRINTKEKVADISGHVIPLLDLRDILRRGMRLKAITSKEDLKESNELVLVVRVDGGRYALLVDDILSQQRIVHKNLGMELENLPGVAGGTILSDGNVALILELTSVVNTEYGRAAALAS